MSQIDELQTRISRALDRISKGVDAAASAGASAEESAALQAQLAAAEKTLAETREAAAAAREQAELDIAAAVEAARAEAAAEFDRAVEAALSEAAPEPEPETAPEPEAGNTQPAIDPAEVEALREALEDEKMANAQLEERLRAVKTRQSDGTPAAASPDLLGRLDSELQRLRRANDALLEASASLREANAQGLTDPQLINAAMLAELEAMRAARATDAAEAEAVLGTLTPMLEGMSADSKEGAG